MSRNALRSIQHSFSDGNNLKTLSLFQNPMVFPQALGKSGLKPAFSLKSKVAVPKLKFWNSL
ncbi:MAG: hypothetical protein LBU16_06705, partial [Treponema sp.]|nr:hypothetical protein [Treponema sp.]